MIGRRLKIARTAAGLSLRGLETAIGNHVTAQAIGKYERSESMPGSGVLIALADALGVSVDYLVGDQEMVLEAVDFRKKTITSKREVAQVEAQVLRMLEGYLMVEELLRLPSVEWDKPRDAPFPSSATSRKRTGEPTRYGAIGAWGSFRSPTWWKSWKGVE